MSVFQSIVLPQPTSKERWLLLWNIVPLAFAATFRGFFWWFGIPFSLAGKDHSSRWSKVVETARGDVSSGTKPQTSCELVQATIERGAHTFPHAHGRAFPTHFTGVMKLVDHWGQPQELCLAAMYHSAYSTEMFPWSLFHFTDRLQVMKLIGDQAEEIVFLYCTCSQIRLYQEVHRLAANGYTIPAEGFRAVNCHSGQACLLHPQRAADVLLVLGADIAEQDPYFDLYLVLACLKLAAPYLKTVPPLVDALDKAGYFKLSKKEVDTISAHAKRLLQRAIRTTNLDASSSLVEELKAAARQAPWLWELNHHITISSGGGDSAHLCMEWFELWGTPWSYQGEPDKVRSLLTC